MLYVIGGFAESSRLPVKYIEKYDSNIDTWETIGELQCAIAKAACVADGSNVYCFGGVDVTGNSVNCVQRFDTNEKKCDFVSLMPSPAKNLRAVTWERLVIVTSEDTCLLFHLDTKIWGIRSQFLASKNHFGFLLENEFLYYFGGGVFARDPVTTKKQWTVSDEIRFVSVDDVVGNVPAQWSGRDNYHLPMPCLVFAFAAMNLGSR